MPPLKRRSWGMVASSTSRTSWCAISRLFYRTNGTGRGGRPGHRTCPKKRGGRKRLIDICPTVSGVLPQGASRPHRRGPSEPTSSGRTCRAGSSRRDSPRWGRRSVGISCPRCSASTDTAGGKLRRRRRWTPAIPTATPSSEHRPSRGVLKAGLPVISMDTKKELLGNFYRDGKIDTQKPLRPTTTTSAARERCELHPRPSFRSAFLARACASQGCLAAPQPSDPDTDRQHLSPIDPRLARLCEAWPSLPEHVILVILALADPSRVVEATGIKPP